LSTNFAAIPLTPAAFSVSFMMLVATTLSYKKNPNEEGAEYAAPESNWPRDE